MKRRKIWLAIDIVMCLFFFASAWIIMWFSMKEFYYESLGWASFDLLFAIFAFIMGLVWVIDIIPDDIKKIKWNTKEKDDSGSKIAYEIFEWLLDNQYDETDNSDNLLKNKVFGVWGDELAKKAEEYGVEIIDLRPTEETMKYRRKDK